MSFLPIHYGVSAAAVTAHLVNTDHSYLITVPIAAVSADLTDFPLYINLADMPSDFWDFTNADGGNIRVFNSVSSPLAFDLVSFEPDTHRGTMFIKTPIAAASATVISVSVGDLEQTRLAFTDTYGRNAVWAAYDIVTLFGPDARDRTGKEVVRSAGDPEFLKATAPVVTFTEDMHQGGTFDGEHHYLIDNNTIYKFNQSWSLVATNTNPIGETGLPVVNHLGDPCNKDGVLYIPLEFYSGSSSNEHIVRFNCSDLTFIDAFNISANDHEVSSICYCPRDGLFYVTDYIVGTVHKYNSSFVYQGQLTLGGTIANPQGIEWWNEAFWITNDSADEIYRVEHDGSTTLNLTTTTAQGYSGQPVAGNLEGCWRVKDSLFVLSDPSGADSFITSYERYDSPLCAGGGYQQHPTDASSVVAYTVPSRTVFTMGVSGKITSKAANRSLISFVNDSASAGTNDRVSLAYRSSDLSFAVWDNTNTWLMPATDFDPALTAWSRFHVQYSGTNRALFANGASIASQTGITAKGSTYNSLHIGRDDKDDAEIFRGEIGFAYIRPDALSSAWIAAEYANLNGLGFYTIGDYVEPKGFVTKLNVNTVFKVTGAAVAKLNVNTVLKPEGAVVSAFNTYTIVK